MDKEDLDYIESCKEYLKKDIDHGEDAWIFNHEDKTWECKSNDVRMEFYTLSHVMIENLLNIADDLISGRVVIQE